MKALKALGNKHITASKGIEERFVGFSSLLISRRDKWGIIMCTIYLSAIAICIGQGGSHIKKAVDFGFTSYLMVPIMEELQLLVDIAAAQANTTLRKTKDEMDSVRERVVFMFRDFFDSPLELEDLNRDIASQVQKTIDAINDVKSSVLKVCRSSRDVSGIGIPGVDIPGIGNIPGIDVPGIGIMLPPCPKEVSDIGVSLERIPRMRLPGLEFDVNYNETVQQVRGPDDVKRDIAADVEEFISMLEAVFRTLTVISPTTIAIYVVVRTYTRVRLAIVHGKHKYVRKDYTVRTFLTSVVPIIATIFALILLLAMRVAISAINDVLIDKVYFEYSGSYSCDIRMTPSGSDALADAMKNVGAMRKANGSFSFDTRSDIPGMRRKVTDGEIITVVTISMALIVIAYLGKVAANLEDCYLESLANETRYREMLRAPVSAEDT